MPDESLTELLDRFWSKVDRESDPDGCWLWTAGKAHGYGSFYWRDRNRAAHRVSYILTRCAGRMIPKPWCVLHHCDVKACVRPSHLYVGTYRDNIMDALERGPAELPTGIGEDHYRAKLTEVDVREIRKLYASGGVTYAELAKRFGVATSNIGHIISRRNWRRVD